MCLELPNSANQAQKWAKHCRPIFASQIWKYKYKFKHKYTSKQEKTKHNPPLFASRISSTGKLWAPNNFLIIFFSKNLTMITIFNTLFRSFYKPPKNLRLLSLNDLPLISYYILKTVRLRQIFSLCVCAWEKGLWWVELANKGPILIAAACSTAF